MAYQRRGTLTSSLEEEKEGGRGAFHKAVAIGNQDRNSLCVR